jgi:septation ring formation regulator EzrA
VNSTLADLNDKASLIFSRVNDAKKYRDLDEEEIMFMNRERVKFSDVNVQLSQAENLYINGEYAQCYQMVETVFSKIQSKDTLPE